MPQPTPYDRLTSFRAFSAANPTAQQSGASMDNEFDAVKVAVDETQANLALIQRDDGALANESVGEDQLQGELTIGLNIPRAWETGTAYIVRNNVFINGIIYECLVSHTSGVFATDLAASKWELVVDLTAIPAGSYLAITGGTMTGAILFNAVGSDAAPPIARSSNTNTGIVLPGGNAVGVAVSGSRLATFDSSGISMLSGSFLTPSAGGSAGTPAFSFTGDTNTGMYRVSSDTIGFSAGGTLRASVGTAGFTFAVPALAPDGTASAPGVSFSGDTNTGFYRVGTDEVGMSAGGAVQASVDTSGLKLASGKTLRNSSGQVITGNSPEELIAEVTSWSAGTAIDLGPYDFTPYGPVRVEFEALQLSATGGTNFSVIIFDGFSVNMAFFQATCTAIIGATPAAADRYAGNCEFVIMETLLAGNYIVHPHAGSFTGYDASAATATRVGASTVVVNPAGDPPTYVSLLVAGGPNFVASTGIIRIFGRRRP